LLKIRFKTFLPFPVLKNFSLFRARFSSSYSSM